MWFVYVIFLVFIVSFLWLGGLNQLRIGGIQEELVFEYLSE